MAARPAHIEEFLAAARPERRGMIEAIDAVVRDAAPDLATGAHGRMVGYGMFHYRYESGREGDTFTIAMMDGSQALSVYVAGTERGSEDGKHLAEARADRLGRVSVGKSCIRVKRLEHLDLDEFRQLVVEAAAQFRSGELGTPLA